MGGIFWVILATTKCITDQGWLKITFVLLIAPISVDSSNQNYQNDVPEDKMDFHSLIEIDGQLTYQKKTNATSFFELKKLE